MKKNSVMVSANRFWVYAFALFCFVFAGIVPAFCKGARVSDSSISSENVSGPVDQFPWSGDKKLTWDDFRGDVKAADGESAAATHCGIGFKVSLNNPDNKPKIIVYNTFYATKSWVRPDAKIQSILAHEQGHFDLCEIYTRKLRERMDKFDFNVPDVKQALMETYNDISQAYESCQQKYEQETVHGTNIEQQKKWIETIGRELML